MSSCVIAFALMVCLIQLQSIQPLLIAGDESPTDFREVHDKRSKPKPEKDAELTDFINARHESLAVFLEAHDKRSKPEKGAEMFINAAHESPEEDTKLLERQLLFKRHAAGATRSLPAQSSIFSERKIRDNVDSSVHSNFELKRGAFMHNDDIKPEN